MNTITITGRVETEPVRKEANDTVVTTFRLASGRTGNRGGRLWIDIDAWGRLGGTAARSAQKGRTVVVTGRLQARSYHDRTGAKQTHWSIVASDIEYLAKPGARLDAAS